MADHDSLADVATPEALDDTVYAAGQIAYESGTGQDIPDHVTPWPELDRPSDFDDAEAMASKYPPV